ncbi:MULTISPECIES: hypothetical protein [unclassified Duganella]|nr:MULTISPECIES: hypothetical protein [unclassified Duganella]
MSKPQKIGCNPLGDNDGLHAKKNWGTEEASKGFCFQPEQVTAKRLG